MNIPSYIYARSPFHGMDRIREHLWVWLAWHLPHGLVYWCAVRVASHASVTKLANHSVPNITVMDVLEAWRK